MDFTGFIMIYIAKFVCVGATVAHNRSELTSFQCHYILCKYVG